MPKLSIRDLDLTGKRVLIRVDFNVPLSRDGAITDDTRIRETVPTIEYALRRKAKVILAAHLGRPKGHVVDALTLRPMATRLRTLLDGVMDPDENVAFSPDCVGAIALELANNLEPGQTLLLENLRFHPEEEANDPAFAEQLAALCDVYVDDAFGAAHRAHASTEGITHFIKKQGGQCAAGLLMEKELTYLGKAVNEPNRPFVAIIGGAKVSDKIEVINALLSKVDSLLIGGAMAYTFLTAMGQSTGKSLVELDKLDVARAALKKAEAREVKFLLPVDHCLADKFSAEARTQLFSGDGAFPENLMALDIGPETIKLFSAEIAEAATIVWNGPMGVAELAPFAKGTNAIARAIAKNEDCISIVGGGDSVAALHNSGVADKVTHISTGGGASLEFLEGKVLPGVAALSNKEPDTAKY
jgi:phosphoglycerate kinase